MQSETLPCSLDAAPSWPPSSASEQVEAASEEEAFLSLPLSKICFSQLLHSTTPAGGELLFSETMAVVLGADLSTFAGQVRQARYRLASWRGVCPEAGYSVQLVRLSKISPVF